VPELVIVANRLPVEYAAEEGWRRAPGGLVSAMQSVLRDTPATWVGWSGGFSDAGEDGELSTPPVPADAIEGVELVEVPLTRAEVAAHYDGFSNGALWPNYHGGIVAPVYHRSQFETHREVNRRFADLVAERARPGARVWVHDYQLQLVPALLRASRPDLRIGFFLHIPFPPVEIFSQLPWRTQVLAGLLGADVVGFQTSDAVVNFQRAARRFADVTDREGELHVAGPGGPRPVAVRAYPIGIRASDYADMSGRPEVQERAGQVRSDVGDPDVLLLGVDRLDYTKGIDVRVQAVTELMLDGDLDPQRTAFIQVAQPTRDKVDEYQRIRDEVELLVSRANGDLGPVGTNPIHYMHQAMGPDELAALYLAADVMLVTPLRDGMNLVAKEYVATRTDDRGALVLSEFTGAAEQMTQAWLVNPYDVEGMKRTILAALREPAEQAARRMRALRAGVVTHDVSRWADDFLVSLAAPDLALPADLARELEGLVPTQRLLVALDFDGTISPIVAQPSAARPIPGALDLLRQLATAPGTEVVLISGRARQDLATVSSAADVATLIGSHGQEASEDLLLTDPEAVQLAEMRARVADAVGGIPGVLLEDKPAGLAVHVRACTPADADVALDLIRGLADELAGTFWLEGKRVVEMSLRPLDKGVALQVLIEADPERRVLFAGDDVTDEAAMAVLRPTDISIRVGPDESVARFRVPGPPAMLEVLGHLARLRGSGSAAPGG